MTSSSSAVCSPASTCLYDCDEASTAVTLQAVPDDGSGSEPPPEPMSSSACESQDSDSTPELVSSSELDTDSSDADCGYYCGSVRHFTWY